MTMKKPLPTGISINIRNNSGAGWNINRMQQGIIRTMPIAENHPVSMNMHGMVHHGCIGKNKSIALPWAEDNGFGLIFRQAIDEPDKAPHITKQIHSYCSVDQLVRIVCFNRSDQILVFCSLRHDLL